MFAYIACPCRFHTSGVVFYKLWWLLPNRVCPCAGVTFHGYGWLNTTTKYFWAGLMPSKQQMSTRLHIVCTPGRGFVHQRWESITGIRRYNSEFFELPICQLLLLRGIRPCWAYKYPPFVDHFEIGERPGGEVPVSVVKSPISLVKPAFLRIFKVSIFFMVLPCFANHFGWSIFHFFMVKSPFFFLVKSLTSQLRLSAMSLSRLGCRFRGPRRGGRGPRLRWSHVRAITYTPTMVSMEALRARQGFCRWHPDELGMH